MVIGTVLGAGGRVGLVVGLVVIVAVVVLFVVEGLDFGCDVTVTLIWCLQ